MDVKNFSGEHQPENPIGGDLMNVLNRHDERTKKYLYNVQEDIVSDLVISGKITNQDILDVIKKSHETRNEIKVLIEKVGE